MARTSQVYRKEAGVMTDSLSGIFNPFTYNPFSFHQDDEDPDYLIAKAISLKEQGLSDEKYAPE